MLLANQTIKANLLSLLSLEDFSYSHLGQRFNPEQNMNTEIF